MNTCTACNRTRHNTDLVLAAGEFFCHGVLDETPTCYQMMVLGGEGGEHASGRTEKR